MKKGTRADRRLKQEQRRGIVTMGRVGEGKAYLVDMYGRKVTFDAHGRISGKGIDKVRAEMREEQDSPTGRLPHSALFGLLYGMSATRLASMMADRVSEDLKKNVTAYTRVNAPGTIDLIQREDGIYE